METKFYINGKLSTKYEALEFWISSDTYKRANKKTREKIFNTALKGDRTGNHNPSGEVEHLLEAGIELK